MQFFRDFQKRKEIISNFANRNEGRKNLKKLEDSAKRLSTYEKKEMSEE